MGSVKGSFKECLFIGFLFLLNCVFAQESSNEETKAYIVYLGERQHDDPELVSESHHRMLESVFESPEAARESIIYNYHHGFSGFAARLTESQAKKLSDRPDVFSVASNRKLALQTTRTYDYLGLSPNLPNGILHESDMGSELVIGFLDSGVWPESRAYNDEGLGPIPKHWKGGCVAGTRFDPAKHCNKKLVGAKYFRDGLFEKNPGVELSGSDFMSPRGLSSHGTISSSVAASSFVPNASYKGLAPGLMRGAAPKARIAMYKVGWEKDPFGAAMVDLVKAFDEAIKDGVDVLSVSIGGDPPPFRPLTSVEQDLHIGSFHAVMKGIPVIAAAGNSGPEAYTISNVAPWLFTVGATSIDRTYYVDLTLGHNITIMAQALYTGEGLFAELVYVEDWENDTSDLRGKVAFTFAEDDDDVTGVGGKLGCEAVIIARSSDYLTDVFVDSAPSIAVDYEVGTKILKYIRSSSLPTVRISAGKTFVGRPKSTTVAGFSCRGPSAQSPAILKPDIVAPGVLLLSAEINDNEKHQSDFVITQGTSVATPVVAGIVVLLKAVHPDWSPAALKSAIMTTAWKTDLSGEPMFAEGLPRKLADPFDYGAGLINAERAKDPGLVYDMNLDDYIFYFCASGYNDTAITVLTGKPTKCSSPLPSVLDVNYPAITIPDLNGEVTVTRTVTNVGPVDSVYRAVVEAPEGVKIAVEPETLAFNSSTKKLGFKVKVTTSHKCDTGYFFGSFTWTDGTRNVVIPLSVRTRVSML
ncbi:Subtilisin-like protease 2 [Hirschfeldia incana]|nr:Subtilisin-like protease 2 [Hirschfeldia incana]